MQEALKDIQQWSNCEVTTDIEHPICFCFLFSSTCLDDYLFLEISCIISGQILETMYTFTRALGQKAELITFVSII